MRLTKLSHALVTVFAAILLAVTTLTAEQKNPLTNADVIKMVKAEMAESTITAASLPITRNSISLPPACRL